MNQNKEISVSQYYQLVIPASTKEILSFSEFKQLAARAIYGKQLKTIEQQKILSTSLLNKKSTKILDKLLAKFLAGTPVAYLTGHTEFYGYNVLVNKNVLIPRVETEQLVTLAKEYLLANPTAADRILEIGTGSGCIAISLAKELENSLTDNAIIAIDKSILATKVAKANLERFSVKNIISIENISLLKYLNYDSHKSISLIISNPPYLTTEQMSNLPVQTEAEPRAALFGGKDGLRIYRQILHLAKKQLKEFNRLPALFLEADPAIMQNLVSEIAEVYPTSKIKVHKDLFGLERFITALQP